MTAKVENNLAYKFFGEFRPDENVAYITAEGEVSYSALYLACADFGAYLKERGVTLGDRVLIAMYDSPAVTSAFIGALSVGAVPIVVNPEFSKETYAYLLEDSSAVMVVCEYENLEKIVHGYYLAKSPKEKHILVNDIYINKIEKRSENSHFICDKYSSIDHKVNEMDICPVSADHPAFWQYTSGTTGKPKGVMHVAETMIFNTEQYAINSLGISEKDVLYSCAKMFFGYGLGASLFFNLLTKSVCILDRTMPASDISVAKILTKHRPTVFFGVPAIYSALLQFKDKIKDGLCREMMCISAGSRLPESILNSWREAFGLNIYDGIGATEMGHIFIGNSPGSSKFGTTGKVIPGYEVKLARGNSSDSQTNSKEGILHVKGQHINLGYWNQSKASSEKFVDGWYITGDVFQVDEDGFYTHICREDEQFKINGLWVTPVPLEHKLIRDLGIIKECVMVPFPDKNGLSQAAVYAVAAEEGLEKEAIKKYIAEWFKENCEAYCRPKKIVLIDKLPRNENGKLLRRVLSEESVSGCAVA